MKTIIKRIRLKRLENELKKISDSVLEIQIDTNKRSDEEIEKLLSRIRKIEYKAKKILNWNFYNKVSKIERKSDMLKDILFDEKEKITECKILRIREEKLKDEIINI